MKVSFEVDGADEFALIQDMMQKLDALRAEKHKQWMDSLVAAAQAHEEAAPVEEAPKKRKAKVEAVAPAPEPEIIKEPSLEKPAPVVIDAEPAYTTDNVREAVVDLSAALGSDAARSLLAEFGARKASEVSPDQIGAFVKAAKAKINDRANSLVD